MAIGTMTLADLQATLNASTVYRVGLDTTFDAIQRTLDAYNAQVAEMLRMFLRITTEESVRYGGDDSMVMEDADEFTVPRAQKITAGSTVGFPLNAVVIGHQWTEMWFRKHTIEEMAAFVNARMRADRARILRDIKRAIYYPTNYTHRDHLARNVDLPVKRLVNADSAAIPPGPNGETFTASSHTHYLARAGGSVAASDVDALVSTVREHYDTGEIQVAIAAADEATMRALSGFVAYPDPRLVFSVDTTRTVGRSLDVANTYNRAIGIISGAEVVIKPWAVGSRWFAYNADAPKTLAYRYDPDYGDGLQLVRDENAYPWTSQGFRRVFGVGVENRVNGAILDISGTSYSQPSIA